MDDVLDLLLALIGKGRVDSPSNRALHRIRDGDASGLGEVTQSLRSLLYYHRDVYTFHTHFLNCSSHHYESPPSGWLFINRPVGVAADTDIKPTDPGCDAPQGSFCYRQVLLIGTPVIWWGGAVALLFAGVMWLGTRDWRYGVITPSLHRSTRAGRGRRAWARMASRRGETGVFTVGM